MMRKALLYRFMNNINQVIYKTDLTHREISIRVGNAKNWFNDAYNNNEDIHISSFIRILSIIDEELNINEYGLTDIFDKKMFEIVSLMHFLTDHETDYYKEIINHDRDIFIELIADWKSMDYRKKLNDVEKYNMNKIVSFISMEVI